MGRLIQVLSVIMTTLIASMVIGLLVIITMYSYQSNGLIPTLIFWSVLITACVWLFLESIIENLREKIKTHSGLKIIFSKALLILFIAWGAFAFILFNLEKFFDAASQLPLKLIRSRLI